VTGEGQAPRPLEGWRVVVTRARLQSSELVRALEVAGASALEVPVIEIAEPVDGGVALVQALGRLQDFDWVVFSSANAVERCLGRLASPAALGRVKVAAIGTRTAAALAAGEVVVDLLPVDFVAESLVAVFPAPALAGSGSVLLPCAPGAREALAAGLRQKGWRVEVVEAYRTLRPAIEGSGLVPVGADAITFTSSSTVTGYLELLGRAEVPPVVACIGPVTAATARDAGLHVDVVATEHTVDGLVEALGRWVAARVTPHEGG